MLCWWACPAPVGQRRQYARTVLRAGFCTRICSYMSPCSRHMSMPLAQTLSQRDTRRLGRSGVGAHTAHEPASQPATAASVSGAPSPDVGWLGARKQRIPQTQQNMAKTAGMPPAAPPGSCPRTLLASELSCVTARMHACC